MADIETGVAYTMKLTEREYQILYDSLCYTINSIFSVQAVDSEYLALRGQIQEAMK